MTKRRIVIIDDDKEDLNLIRDILMQITPEGEVTDFTDPVTGLDFLLQTSVMPDLIICDMNMPKLDGFKLRSMLLKANTEVSQVPFFILSTADMNWELLVAKKLKIKSCCTKKASEEGMKNTIREILESVGANG